VSKGRYHWSNTANPPRFFKINAVAALPLLILILFPSLTWLYIASGLIVFLVYVEKFKKMTPIAYFRSVNIFVTGRIKSSLSFIKEIKR
jgi:hypothetical protein